MSAKNHQRAVQPPGPARPRSSAMAAPTRRIAVLEKTSVLIERTGEVETVTVVGSLSDGRTVERDEKIRYGRGERERAMRAAIEKGDLAVLGAAIDRRAKVVERLRGELQREYGRGVPWVEAASVAAA